MHSFDFFKFVFRVFNYIRSISITHTFYCHSKTEKAEVKKISVFNIFFLRLSYTI